MKQQKFVFNITINIKKLSVAALLSGAAILFYACENNLEEIKAFTTTENLPTLEAENIERLSSDSGQVRFLMKAPQLLQFEGDEAYIEFPKGIELIEYDEKENIVSSITANYARQYQKEQKWEAKNNVVVTNDKGDTLKTELLILEGKTQKIHTDAFVKIISPDRILTGIGFESDQNMEYWKIKEPKGDIYVNVQEPKDTTAPRKETPAPSQKKSSLDAQAFKVPQKLQK